MKDIVGNNSQNILLSIVIVLCVYIIFNTNTVKTDVKGYEKQMEKIQTQIDSSAKVNKDLEMKLVGIKDNITTITNEIHQVDKNLTIIKNNTNEKVNNVDKLHNNELELFFTNRYENASSK